ncbi:MAG: hypothetical protein ACRCTY_05530, partial [Candidatus Adiutrix sp.]
GEIHLRHLHLEAPHILRRPTQGSSAEKSEGKAFPLAINIEELSLQQAVINHAAINPKEIFGAPLEFSTVNKVFLFDKQISLSTKSAVNYEAVAAEFEGFIELVLAQNWGQSTIKADLNVFWPESTIKNFIENQDFVAPMSTHLQLNAAGGDFDLSLSLVDLRPKAPEKSLNIQTAFKGVASLASTTPLHLKIEGTAQGQSQWPPLEFLAQFDFAAINDQMALTVAEANLEISGLNLGGQLRFTTPKNRPPQIEIEATVDIKNPQQFAALTGQMISAAPMAVNLSLNGDESEQASLKGQLHLPHLALITNNEESLIVEEVKSQIFISNFHAPENIDFTLVAHKVELGSIKLRENRLSAHGPPQKLLFDLANTVALNKPESLLEGLFEASGVYNFTEQQVLINSLSLASQNSALNLAEALIVDFKQETISPVNLNLRPQGKILAELGPREGGLNLKVSARQIPHQFLAPFNLGKVPAGDLKSLEFALEQGPEGLRNLSLDMSLKIMGPNRKLYEPRLAAQAHQAHGPASPLTGQGQLLGFGRGDITFEIGLGAENGQINFNPAALSFFNFTWQGPASTLWALQENPDRFLSGQA